MGTPNLFPTFLKRGATVATASGIVYITQFDVEVLDVIEVEIIDELIVVEILDQIEVALVDDTIEVEIS